MKYDEEDNMLIDMLSDANEDVRDSLYEKYLPTVKFVVKKFMVSAKRLGLEQSDLMQEANVAFTDAINTYDQSKDASLQTFIVICVQRRLSNVISKAQTIKSKMDQQNLSLDYDYDEEGRPLKEVLGSDLTDPSLTFSEKETMEELKRKIKEQLSPLELEVFSYMINGLNYQEIAEILDKSPKQIDNTMQRVRAKARALLKEE